MPGYYDHINGMVDEVIARVTGGYKTNSYQANDFKLFGEYLSNSFTYYLPITSAADNSSELARLWFFGTGGEFECIGQIGADCVNRDQVEWFRKESRAIPKSSPFRSNGIVFMSNPLQEHLAMVNS